MKITLVNTRDPEFGRALERIVQRRKSGESNVEKAVAEIAGAVKKRGDRALVHYARVFDHIRLSRNDIEIKSREIDQAIESVSRKDLQVLRHAARRIAAFHRRQLEKSWGYRDSLGLFLGQQITPLERVGVYVPGGKASYPSTVLMNVIPAKVAGVREIIMASPITHNSAIILAAARIAGVDRIFRIGGAQAIAALAYGTATVPRVDKVAGPGNIYVATAKRLVFGEVDIDSIAGPSEILILADRTANPSFVAADMLSQAEHDELASALCVTTSIDMARRIRSALERQLKATRRQAITVKALERYGAIIVTRGLNEGIDVANTIAPEHVELMVEQPKKWARLIRNAGAIFLGPYTTPPLGDYLAGPNHVLPTGGSARFFSPLGTYDFLKRTSVIQAGRKSLRSLGADIMHLARLEGLDDHARAVEVRLA
ncbi:MAG: histidinol dehydrogenase [Deltaproteobacteria bacterium]|nr:histidinol dehydrogenase [Deltaproteobacteria bacterium]